MQKITNIQSATDYVYAQLKELNPTIERDDVYDTIMDEVLESAEYIMTDDDVKYLEENEKNEQAIDAFLQEKIPDYTDLLTDIVVDMVSDEITE
jgi:hypothetical protein